MGHDGRIVPISIFISNILHPTRSLYDSLRLPVQKLWLKRGFNVFDDLDLWHICYIDCHKSRHGVLEYSGEVSK